MTVAVATGDPTVSVMDAQFSALIAADLTATIDGFLLGFEVAAGATGATPLDVPAPFRVWHDMVAIWFFAHVLSP